MPLAEFAAAVESLHAVATWVADFADGFLCYSFGCKAAESEDAVGAPVVSDWDVAKVFEGYPEAVRAALLRLRTLIQEVARETEGVGALQETLKWGQPSYLTAESKAGVTVRIDQIKGDEQAVGLYVHCQSGLIEQFKVHYREQLRFEGKRVVVLKLDEPLPEGPLRHCIALALTHHRRKKKART